MAAEPRIDDDRADRLRAALAAAADAAPEPADDWADVVHRADRTAIPLAPTATGRRPPRWVPVAVAAAVVALVAGAAVAIRSTDDGSDHGRDTVRAEAADPEPTGWYVPTRLPTGWSVDEVIWQGGWVHCPCRTQVWGDTATGEQVSVTRSVDEPGAPDDGSVPIDLGGGTAGLVRTEGETVTVRWVEGRASRTVEGVRVDADRVEDLARGLAGEPDPTTSPLGGWPVLWDRSAEGPSVRNDLVIIRITTAAGHGGAYVLTFPDALDVGGQAATDHAVPGQPRPVLELRSREGGPSSISYFGSWPGADVAVVPSTAFGELTTAEVDTLLASLRPATRAGWRTFVDGLRSYRPELRRADTLTDLGTFVWNVTVPGPPWDEAGTDEKPGG